MNKELRKVLQKLNAEESLKEKDKRYQKIIAAIREAARRIAEEKATQT